MRRAAVTSVWQKGSDEHLNGMLRRYFPFNMPADEITCEQVREINIKINSMPRAILGFRTPLEAFRDMQNAQPVF